MKILYHYKKSEETKTAEYEVHDFKFSQEEGERACKEMLEMLKDGWILEKITEK